MLQIVDLLWELRPYSKSSLTLTLECDSNEMHSSRTEVEYECECPLNEGALTLENIRQLCFQRARSSVTCWNVCLTLNIYEVLKYVT